MNLCGFSEMGVRHVCSYKGCEETSIGIIGISYHPVEAVTKYYGDLNMEIARMAIGTEVCTTHYSDFDLDAILNSVPPNSPNSTTIREIFCLLIEEQFSTLIDRNRCNKILLTFDSEEYQVLINRKEKK